MDAYLASTDPLRPFPVPSATPSDPATTQLAVLLLGFGREGAARWAQARLGIEPADGRTLSLVGELGGWASSEAPEGFAPEPEGRLNWMLGRLLAGDGQLDRAEPFWR